MIRENNMSTGNTPPLARSVDHATTGTSAFTLIEMLVAVTVLAVMTLLLSRIISQSNNVISEGSRQATQNANARMAMDFLAREFAQAGGDGRLHFKRNDSPSSPGIPGTYGSSYPCHDLRFCTFNNLLVPNDNSQSREATMVAYYVKDFMSSGGYYSLMRAEQSIPMAGSYSNLLYSSGNEAELIRYVVEFRVVCYETNSYQVINSSSEMDHLPAYFDVFLAVLSETEAKRAKTFALGSSDQRDYIFRFAKRYHTRCWSLNRNAYIQGR